jgi:AraC-like DNA-binding protein
LIVFYPTLIFGVNPSTNALSWPISNLKNIFKKSFEKVEEKTVKTEELDRILNYFETKKPFLNTNFSIHDLSRALNIPQIRISTCFNKQINIPFPTFRNQLRIKHVVQMFREQKHLQMSIEGISKQSGFKTLSAFYAAFRVEYKMTPTVWIEKNL